MSLLFLDGFSHYATADIDKKWDAVNGSPVINPTGGRGGTRGCIEFDTASEYVSKSVNNLATVIIGLAVKVSSLSVAQDIVRFMDSATTQVKIRIRTDGKLEAFRDTTSLGVSAAAPVSAGSYLHLDIRVTIDNAAGSVNVQSGGVAHLNLTGQDTQTSANAYATAVRVGGDGTNTVSVCDLYLADTTGSAPQNAQMGDCRVDLAMPNVEGTYSQFTPSTGTDNSANVDETAQDGDGTYNSTSAVGNRDSFGFPNITDIGGATIFGVQANFMARKDSTGTRQMRAFTRPVGTNYFGTSQALQTSYKNFREIWMTNPETALPWAESEVNLAQLGVEVAS